MTKKKKWVAYKYNSDSTKEGKFMSRKVSPEALENWRRLPEKREINLKNKNTSWVEKPEYFTVLIGWKHKTEPKILYIVKYGYEYLIFLNEKNKKEGRLINQEYFEDNAIKSAEKYMEPHGQNKSLAEELFRNSWYK